MNRGHPARDLTHENFANRKKIRVAAITRDFHMFRAVSLKPPCLPPLLRLFLAMVEYPHRLAH